MNDTKYLIDIKEELFIVEQAEEQSIQEPTLLLDTECFEY